MARTGSLLHAVASTTKIVAAMAMSLRMMECSTLS